MAVQEVLKTTVVVPTSIKQSLMKVLQSWGHLEIIKDKQLLDGSNINQSEFKSSRVREIKDKLDFILNFIYEYSPPVSGFKKLKEGLNNIPSSEAQKLTDKVNVEKVYQTLRDIDHNLKQIETRKNELTEQVVQLNQIKKIDIASSKINFKYIKALPVKTAVENLEKLSKIDNIYIQKINRDEEPLAILYFKKKRARTVFKKLKSIEHKKISIPKNKSPRDKINEFNKKIKTAIKKEKELNQKVEKKYVPDKSKYEVLADIYDNKNTLKREEKKNAATGYTTIITGWIPKNKKTEMQKLLDKKFGNCYLEFKNPAKKDKPPVILNNSALSAPFEVVTDLYGTPDYNWIDPTPHLSIFFILFFGICLGDGGYGLIMVGITLWAMLKFKLSQGARKFIKMLFYGGLASVVVGILAGSWFGNALDGVPVIEKLRVIDALEKPEYFLYFSIGLGYVQVTYGVLISLVKNFQISDYREAVYKDLGWTIALLTLPFITLSLLDIITWNPYLIAVFAVTWVLIFSGYKNKNIFVRFLSGFYEVYDTGIGSLKDMISYSRLFALGMGTTILGMAINEISKFTIELTGWASYIIVPFILLSGHLVMNLFMSSLSAYVHTSRLMYVEFFTKFFKGGGKTFNPLRWKEKRVRIEKTQEI